MKTLKVDKLITRHQTLVEYLKTVAKNRLVIAGKEIILPEEVYDDILGMAEKEDVEGKIVLTSKLPPHLERYCEYIIEPVFDLPREVNERNKILTKINEDLEEFKKYLKGFILKKVIVESDFE